MAMASVDDARLLGVTDLVAVEPQPEILAPLRCATRAKTVLVVGTGPPSAFSTVL